MFIKNLDGYAYELDLMDSDGTLGIQSGYKILADRVKDADAVDWIELDDSELNYLEDVLAEQLYEEYVERAIMRAECYYEGER